MDAETNFIARHDKLVGLFGMTVEAATREYARVRMPLNAEFLNGFGVAHGGTIFALADVAFGAASNADRKFGVVNLNTTIEYLLPGKVGPLVAEARAVREGGHILSYNIQIFDGEGNLIAHALTSGYLTRLPLPA